MSQLSDRSIQDAEHEIGVREIGHTNTGVQVDKWLRFVGLAPGNPWCAAFVCAMIYQAAAELKVAVKWPKLGSCQCLFDWAHRNGHTHATPVAGDVFLQYHPELKRYAHTGFVKSVEGSSFTSIEGNSNTDGSRDGYEVCSIIRQIQPGKHIFVTIV